MVLWLNWKSKSDVGVHFQEEVSGIVLVKSKQASFSSRERWLQGAWTSQRGKAHLPRDQLRYLCFLYLSAVEAKEKKKQQPRCLLSRGETEIKRIPLPTPLFPGTAPVPHRSSSPFMVRPAYCASTAKKTETQRNEVIFKCHTVVEPRFQPIHLPLKLIFLYPVPGELKAQPHGNIRDEVVWLPNFHTVLQKHFIILV